MRPVDVSRPGPLAGLRVVELASECAAFCGKILGDLGATVILVEPEGGHHTRMFEPFADDVRDPDRSLWWMTYNTSKRALSLDLERDAAEVRELLCAADIVIESEPPGRLRALHLDYDRIAAVHDSVVWVSITPFGQKMPSSGSPATDLTALAGGGAVWSCGYDDHSVPPVRGGGNQAYHTASVWGAVGALVAVVHRDVLGDGRGQFLDVSIHAAVNVTTEVSSFEWLVRRATVQRQTGRHASTQHTTPTIVVAGDGVPVTTGVPPRKPAEFAALLSWLSDLGMIDDFVEAVFLEMGMMRTEGITVADLEDPTAAAIHTAGRAALAFIASSMPAHEFFLEAQRRGIVVGVINTIDRSITDDHLVARGYPVTLFDMRLQREITYAGAPFMSEVSPWRMTSAPGLSTPGTGATAEVRR